MSLGHHPPQQMAWQFTPYAVPPFLSALISGALVWYAWRYRSRDVAPYFVAVMATVSLWSVAHAVQLGFDDRGAQLFWSTVVSTIGGGVVPELWLLLTLAYADALDRLDGPWKWLLLVDPVAYPILLWTNGAHELVWTDVQFVTDASQPIIEFAFGPAYYLHLLYSYALVVAGIAFLLRVYWQSSRLYRRQAGLLVLGAVVPLTANVLFNTGASPLPELDLTTFSFTLTGLVFAFALFRYDFLDLTPAAYRNVAEVLGDGLLVLDSEHRLVEFNDTATAVLDAALAVGTPASTIFDRPLADLSGTVVTGANGGTQRYYELRYAPLEDRNDDAVGHLVVLRDVTDSRGYEQRLEVTNRVLRHNLRNELSVITGQTEYLQATLTDGDEQLDRILGAADRLTAVSEKARYIQSSMDDGDRPLVPVDIVPVTAAVVDQSRTDYPDATFLLDAPDSAPVLATGEKLIRTALENLVENAAEHAGGAPLVEVTVTTDGEWVTVSVADDGPGLPPEEQQVIRDGQETSLQHGSGLGLWLVNWAVESVSGNISFEGTGDADGTVVTLRFQRADGGD